jgi:hypothetical protein
MTVSRPAPAALRCCLPGTRTRLVVQPAPLSSGASALKFTDSTQIRCADHLGVRLSWLTECRMHVRELSTRTTLYPARAFAPYSGSASAAFPNAPGPPHRCCFGKLAHGNHHVTCCFPGHTRPASSSPPSLSRGVGPPARTEIRLTGTTRECARWSA